jgi:hypothetical protein
MLTKKAKPSISVLVFSWYLKILFLAITLLIAKQIHGLKDPITGDLQKGF